MPVTVPPIPTPVPQSTDPLNFDARADAVLSSLPGVVTGQNAQNVENNTINANVNAQRLAAGISESAASLSALAAASSANFRGAWSALTGALNVPASVLHNGQIWQLLTNQSNVAAAVPGVSAAWYPVVGIDVASRAPIAPTLDLDFANQRYRMYDSAAGGLSSVALASILTYTGANRTFVDAQGILRVQASNVPRLTFDPVTGAGNGLSVFEARTNLLLHSGIFDNASWNTLTAATLTANIIGPYGNPGAYTLTSTGSGAVLQQAPSVAVGTLLTGTIWIRRRSGTGGIRLRVGEISGLLLVVTNEWARVSFTNTTTSTTGRLGITFDVSGDAVDIWGAQMEVGASPTPYIPTTTVAVTAPADLASLTGTNFSKWFNPVEGTFVWQHQSDTGPSAGASNARSISVTDGSGSNRISGLGIGISTISGGVGDGGALIGANHIGNVVRAGSYIANQLSFSTAGSAVVTDTVFTMPAGLNRMDLGHHLGIVPLNGTISRLLYFPRALPANLQSLSA